jgi:hypothetical protein
MRAWYPRSAPKYLPISALLLLCACNGGDEGGATVLDAIVQSSDAVVAAVEDDPDTWQVDVATGIEIAGTLDESGGTIDVTGWRSSMEYLPGQSQYLNFAEKLFLDLSGFNAAGLSVTGSVVVTRHSLDFGTDDKIDDASRTTHYAGNVVTNGSVQGSFVLDVHANATGTTLWTCGVINAEETGSGRCY